MCENGLSLTCVAIGWLNPYHCFSANHACCLINAGFLNGQPSSHTYLPSHWPENPISSCSSQSRLLSYTNAGIPRPRHSSELPLYHPLSPGSLGSVPHHLEVYNVPWQGQPFYPLTSALRSPYPALINASGMSRLGHPGLPPHHHGMAVTGIPHPAIVTSGTRQQDTLQQSNDRYGNPT